MKFSVFATLAALAVAQPASAVIITVTTNGTLTSGFDQSGMFGPANSDLGGAIFSMVTTFDTDLGTVFTDPTHEQLYWWWQTNLTPTAGATALTVNGVTVNGTATIEADLIANGSGYFGVHNKEVLFGDHVTTENDVFLNANLNPAMHLGDSWHSDCPAAVNCTGSFQYSKYNFLSVPGNPSSYIYVNTGVFDIDSIDVTVEGSVYGPVPEPATWAMMILGFGLVGSAMRRRAAVAA